MAEWVFINGSMRKRLKLNAEVYRDRSCETETRPSNKSFLSKYSCSESPAIRNRRTIGTLIIDILKYTIE